VHPSETGRGSERYEFLSMPLQRFERASSPSDPSPDPEEPS